ncbi:MAG: hypothetical protein QW134_09650 [Nitrososphaeria archaeon]
MDMVAVFLVLFFYIATFSYLAYKLYKKSVERWVQVGHIIWVILGFLMFLAGFHSGNVVTMVIGLAIALVNTSFFFTYHIIE